jgi:hypothetical protein
MRFTLSLESGWTRITGLVLAVPLSLALGCSRVGVVTPKGFVELPDQEEYDYRATTADGLVLGVREIENDPRGELSFWARAIENQLRRQGGYALLETKDVKSKDGVAGKQFRFGHDEAKAPHLYYVAVYVTPSTIALVEIGGSKELVTQAAAEVDFAFANFSVD